MKSKKILICDDSEVCRAVARYALENAGHTVVELDTPIGLSSAIVKEAPDLVLVDVQMPALNGDRAIELVRRNVGATCPLVLYSDRPEAELERLKTKSGATAWVRKTDDTTALMQTVKALLPRR